MSQIFLGKEEYEKQFGPIKEEQPYTMAQAPQRSPEGFRQPRQQNAVSYGQPMGGGQQRQQPAQAFMQQPMFQKQMPRRMPPPRGFGRGYGGGFGGGYGGGYGNGYGGRQEMFAQPMPRPMAQPMAGYQPQQAALPPQEVQEAVPGGSFSVTFAPGTPESYQNDVYNRMAKEQQERDQQQRLQAIQQGLVTQELRQGPTLPQARTPDEAVNTYLQQLGGQAGADPRALRQMQQVQFAAQNRTPQQTQLMAQAQQMGLDPIAALMDPVGFQNHMAMRSGGMPGVSDMLMPSPRQPIGFGTSSGIRYNLAPRSQPMPQPTPQPMSLFGGNYNQPYSGGMPSRMGMSRPSANTGMFEGNNIALLQALLQILGRR
jgi:hypothetical protein